MNITEAILEAAFIVWVAIFLLNTGRALKAIEVCKECLIFLNTRVVKIEGEIFNLPYIGIYKTIFSAYRLIPDHTQAVIYGRKLLEIYRQCNAKEEEGSLSMSLANIYCKHYRYPEAMELYEKAINITKERGDRKNEAYANHKVGLIYHCLNDYEKAKIYIQKALTINVQIGEKEGEASSTITWELCVKILVNMTKLKNILRKHLPSQ